jgi:propionyl-CoA synthetase
MPMVPEAVAAMLACTRIGAIHSVVFGGFAAPELGSRIKDAKAKAVITCTFGMDGLKKILYKPIVD